MICSAIIPTIARPSLSRAVTSVLNQDFPQEEFEIIVVNDSGKPLRTEMWMDSPRVKILHTDRHNRSVARNAGAAVARGKYFHFLDDDDWILPDAYRHLHERAKVSSQAGWVHGGFRLTGSDGKTLKEIQQPETGNCFVQMIASEWIPLQASWIAPEAFFSAGGFASLQSLAGGYEDIDLARLVARCYDFARTPEIVAVIRFGDAGSTTDYQNFFQQNRRSREKNLNLPGAFSRLRASARSSAYWQGKMAYYYLASIPWNLRQKGLTRAASRAVYFLLAMVTSGVHLLSPTFWRAVGRPHFNLTRTSLGEVGDRMYSGTQWRK